MLIVRCIKQSMSLGVKSPTVKKLITLLLTCSLLVIMGCATSHHAPQWEYKSVQMYLNRDLDQELNKLALEGWTVVSSSSSQRDGDSVFAVVILKRPRQ
jgi:hypothetical protein